MFNAPCNWPVLGCDNCTAYTNLSEEMRLEVDAWAVQYLWNWTKRRFGPCEVSYRPCRSGCRGYGGVFPWVIGGRFYNLRCGQCGDSCSCKHVSQIVLPGPIAEPTEILIDGEVLPLDAVRVDNYDILVRVDGGHFPECQDLGANVDEIDTWQVSYLQGEAIPAGGSLAAGQLACEYAKSICGDPSCRLPQRISSITRQGMTIAMLDDFRGLDEGYTGIWMIDSWISAANNPPKRSTVSSPDVPVPRQTTWQYESS